MAATLERYIDAPAEMDADDDDLAHFVCCVDMDAAFCGLDVSGADWAEDHAEVCTRCQMVSRLAIRACPFGLVCPE